MPMPAPSELSDSFMEWLGTPAESEQKLVRLVEAGLNTNVVDRLINNGLSRDEVFRLIIKPRTLRYRALLRRPLSPEESERTLRLVRTISIAESVFGDRNKALHWLRQPKRRLAGRAPIQILSTEPGGRLVEQMLAQIDEGMFA